MLQSFAEKQTAFGIHIALALIYNSKLYTCNVGKFQEENHRPVHNFY